MWWIKKLTHEESDQNVFLHKKYHKIGSLDRHKLDIYLGDHGALPASLVVVRPVALGEIHILKQSPGLPTLPVLVLFPS